MFLIRDVFRCKPGQAGALARKFLADESNRSEPIDDPDAYFRSVFRA